MATDWRLVRSGQKLLGLGLRFETLEGKGSGADQRRSGADQKRSGADLRLVRPDQKLSASGLRPGRPGLRLVVLDLIFVQIEHLF